MRQNTQGRDDEGKVFTVGGTIHVTPVVKGCKRCKEAGFTDGLCAYCDQPLSVRHEHDHYPIPRRHGGEKIVPICVNCHDLKDRVDLENWPTGEAERALRESPPIVRIFHARVAAVLLDAMAELDEREAADERG